MAAIKACGNVFLLVCGKHIGIFDYRNLDSACLLSLPQTDDPQKQKAKQGKDGAKKETKDSTVTQSCSNRILATQFSSDGQFLAVCDDHKYLHVFRNEAHEQPPVKDGVEDRWKLTSSRCVSRRCSAVTFTSDHTSILVADKSGDVFSFPTVPDTPLSTIPTSSSSSSPTTAPPSTDTISSLSASTTTLLPTSNSSQIKNGDSSSSDKEKKDVAEEVDADDGGNDNDGDGGQVSSGGGNLLMGHLSMLLDMLLIDDDRLLVTSDRDEKIRISYHPEAYNIHTYCLGHTAFVITLAKDDSNKLLFSGSGDGTLKLWDYDGHLLDSHDCKDDFPLLNQRACTDQETGEDMCRKKVLQQISYCSDCNLLFVSFYRFSHILVYKLIVEASSSSYSLQPLHVISGNSSLHYVVSLAIRQCVLWVVRETEWPQLQLEAVRVTCQDGQVLTQPVNIEEDSVESKLLNSVSKYPRLMKAPDSWQDPIPTLWKSTTDGYLQEYMQRKRQRLEEQETGGGNAGKNERWGRKKKKQGWKGKDKKDGIQNSDVAS